MEPTDFIPSSEPDLIQSFDSTENYGTSFYPYGEDLFNSLHFDWDPNFDGDSISYANQEDSNFLISKEQHGASSPDGQDTSSKEGGGLIHAQNNHYPAELPLVNLDYPNSHGQSESYATINRKEFFQDEELDSSHPQAFSIPETSELKDGNIGITSYPSPTSGANFQTPPKSPQPQVSGAGESLVQIPPLSHTIDPSLPSIESHPFHECQAPNLSQTPGPRPIGTVPHPFYGHYLPLSSQVTGPRPTGTAPQPFYGNYLPPSSQATGPRSMAMVPQSPFGLLRPPATGEMTDEDLIWNPVPPYDSKNNRPANRGQVDPTSLYGPLPEIPPSFGDHSQGLPPFRYNRFGELITTHKFSAAQITEYIARNPLHYYTSRFDPKNGKLILWIQNVPFDSSSRYPNVGSDKCRFASCPAPNNSILKGFFRVAFDEQSTRHPPVNPFHCAGFVHLYCLERFCDFPRICHVFNVQPDVRRLLEGKNKMAINRDFNEMKEVVDNFIAFSAFKSKAQAYEESLGYLLTMKSIQLEPKGRKERRERRNASTVHAHFGNLLSWVEAGGHSGQLGNNDIEDCGGRKKRVLAADEDEAIQISKRIRYY